jgi:predicted Fe-Mo cluster-binding NifX family protein
VGTAVKIAIAHDNDYVSPHFGHCTAYAVYTVNGADVSRTDILNPGPKPGKLPALLSGAGVTHVISGGMGPRAVEMFAACGIEVIIGVSGQCDTVVVDCVNGVIVQGDNTCHH